MTDVRLLDSSKAIKGDSSVFPVIVRVFTFATILPLIPTPTNALEDLQF